MKKRFIGATVAIAFLAAGLIPTVAQTASAAPAIVKPQYVAGAAVARKPTYDKATGLYAWKCTYSGWAGVRVNYQCGLYTAGGTLVAGPRTGNFSGGSKDLALEYTAKGSLGSLCTEASAQYNDGSDSDSDRKCT